MKIEFNMENSVSDLFLDFAGEKITSLVINDQEINIENLWLGIHVNIPPHSLKKNERNIIYIHFDNEYNTDGNGLHKYVDIDDKIYLYTFFEPSYAHKAFPCFDQPDIKGSFNLSIIASNNWKIISNESCEKEINSQGYFNNFL